MTRNHAKRVTISQVAKLAGVSAGTVSNYLNDTVQVSPDRSARIQAAIEELHYIPDQTASSLRRKTVKDIYVLTPDLNNTFYTNILHSYMTLAYQEGYHVSISSYEYSGDLEKRMLAKLESARAGSLVIIFNGFDDEEAIERLIRRGLHLLLADRNHTIAGASSLSFDNERSLFDLVRYLREKGYESAALLTEPLILENVRKRHDSFLKAMDYYGYKEENTRVYFDETLVLNKMSQGYLYMRDILKNSRKEDLPQAWVASSDHLAIGMLRAFHEAGYSVPGDFGLAGFDNLVISEYTSPPLTTINQDREYFGRKLWKISGKILKTNECVNEVVPQNLIIRHSC